MRRQDLITALVRNPDHTVLVDGLAVTGLEVTGSTVILHTAKLAGPAGTDPAALDDLRAEHAKELARVREEDRRIAEAEITTVRETGARDLAAEQERAAEELSEVRAAHAKAVEDAVAAAIAAERAARGSVAELKDGGTQDAGNQT